VHNFDEIPTVHSLDEFWHRKYVEDKSGKLVPVQAGAADHGDGDAPAHAIHLPSPSYWPFVAAIGMPMMAYGVIYSWWLVGLGAAVTLVGLYGWALEPSVAE
jgi:cytochrome c oxidase subunit 1